MAQTIYGLMTDYGDGSCGLRWYQNKDIVDRELSDEESESYWMNNGSPAEVLTFPDNIDLVACGFTFSD